MFVMTECRHGMNPAWCADCRNKKTVKKAAKAVPKRRRKAGVADAKSPGRGTAKKAARAQTQRRARPADGSGEKDPASPTDARARELNALTDRGTDVSRPPLLDPDVTTRLVWVLPSGTVYHRRDCQVIDGRTTARSIPSKKARSGGLRRCEHCSPLA